MSERCRHCATPCPDGAEFCCVGCEAVFHALGEAGLGAFYALRDGPGVPALEPDGARRAPELELRDLGDGTVAAVAGLDGVHCAGCVWLVERMPLLVEGVVDARLNLGRGRLELRWQPAHTDLAAITRWLGRFGYTPYSLDTTRGAAGERHEREALARVGVSWALAANVMLLVVAFVCLGYYTYVSAETYLYQAYENRELDRILASAPARSPAPPAVSGGRRHRRRRVDRLPRRRGRRAPARGSSRSRPEGR